MLIEKNYDQAVDIWSLGCVLAELLSVSKPYIKQAKSLPKGKERSHAIASIVDRRHLFLGDSCFPLSPRHSGKKRDESESLISDQDQLLLVNQILGRGQDSLDVRHSFITDKFAREYHDQMITQLEPFVSESGGLAAKFSRSSPELVNLLEQMLEFNPAFRPTAEQLLKLPLFDELRIPRLEHWAAQTGTVIGDIDSTLDNKHYAEDIEQWRLDNYTCD